MSVCMWRDCEDTSSSLYWMWLSTGNLHKTALSKCLDCTDKVLVVACMAYAMLQKSNQAMALVAIDRFQYNLGVI